MKILNYLKCNIFNNHEDVKVYKVSKNGKLIIFECINCHKLSLATKEDNSNLLKFSKFTYKVSDRLDFAYKIKMADDKMRGNIK